MAIHLLKEEKRTLSSITV